MSEEQWTAVDYYFADLLISDDPIMDAVLKASETAGLPAISVAPNQGKLLMILAQIQRAKTILEVGTLGGYSTIWMARALPADGHLITLEISAKHAEVARANIERAGLAGVAEVRLGPAIDSLAQLVAEKYGPFDLVFIDADKPSNADYLGAALKLSRPGTLIIVDNVVRSGAVADPTSTDPSVQGVWRFAEMVSKEPRLSATAIQTVGSKGYDGFALAIVNSV